MKPFIIVAHVLTSLLVLALPNLTRREVLFGVIVPDDFRSRPEGLRAVRMFRLAVVASTLAGVVALLLLDGRPFMLTIAIAPMVTALVAGIAFVAQNRNLKAFGVQPLPVRELELTTEPERLPWVAWLGVVPLVLLAGAALYLRAHWDSIPEIFPIHWGSNGEPNGWSHRNFRAVYGPLIFGGALSAWMCAFAFAAWYGSRRSEPLRKPMMFPLLAAEWMTASISAGVSLVSLLGKGLALIGLAFLPVVFASIIYLIKKSNEPQAVPDPTPPECWKGGMIYYNPNDAALFVGRRDGVGLTFNVANPWSWVIFGSLPLVMVVSALFLLG